MLCSNRHLVDVERRMHLEISRTTAAISLAFILSITPWAFEEAVISCIGAKVRNFILLILFRCMSTLSLFFNIFESLLFTIWQYYPISTPEGHTISTISCLVGVQLTYLSFPFPRTYIWKLMWKEPMTRKKSAFPLY